MRRLALILPVLLLAGCVKPKPLDDFGAAPAFQLTDQSGKVFDSGKLAGHVWVADFIYTTCPGPCPMMSSQMHLLQQQTAAEMSDVKLVSFTVDPKHDTPPVLADYAGRFGDDPARWSFLTGEQAQLNAVGLGFKLNSVDGSLSHSTRFALVDERGHIRGYYTTGEDGFMPRLMHDIRQLEHEKS